MTKRVKEGEWVEILEGFGTGKVFKPQSINTSAGRVTGEISDRGRFYSVTLRYDEVKVVPKPNFND